MGDGRPERVQWRIKLKKAGFCEFDRKWESVWIDGQGAAKAEGFGTMTKCGMERELKKRALKQFRFGE